MSQENVEVVRRLNEAFNRGDTAGVAEHLAPDLFYIEKDAYLDTPPVLRGRDALLDAWAQFSGTFQDFRGDLEDLIDAGEWVVTVTHWRGTGTGSGVSIDQVEVIAWRVENGVAVEGRVFASPEEALEAAGVSE